MHACFEGFRKIVTAGGATREAPGKREYTAGNPTATKPSTSGDLLGWNVGAILELSVAMPLVVMGASAALAAVITIPLPSRMGRNHCCYILA
jgi:hypothetical protein